MGRKKKSRPIPPPIAPPPPAEDISAEIISPVMRRASQKKIKSTYTTKGQKLGGEGEVLGAQDQKFASSSAYLSKPKQVQTKMTSSNPFIQKLIARGAFKHLGRM